MSYASQAVTTTGTYNLAKAQNENVSFIQVYGNYTGLSFTVLGSVDGTNYNQIAVIDNGTLNMVSSGSSISPSNGVAYGWTIPIANPYVSIQINVSAISGGTATFETIGQSVVNGPSIVTVTTSQTSFTNISASGTLAVTGAATFSSTVGITGNLSINTNKLVVTASSGNVASQGSILSSAATGGFGYTTGAGGTVTQSTNKTTGVTLSKASGQITLNNASLASGTTATFALTNTTVAATSDVRCWIVSGEATPGSYQVWASEPSSGAVNINIRNLTGGALGEAVVVGFNVFSAAAS